MKDKEFTYHCGFLPPLLLALFLLFLAQITKAEYTASALQLTTTPIMNMEKLIDNGKIL